MSQYSDIWYLEEVNLMECFCPFNGAQGRYDKQPKREFNKGEFIYFSADNADKVFFIHEGAVKIASYTEDGNELIKAILHEGEVFGEMAVYGEETRSDYAQAIEKTHICALDKDEVTSLMMQVSGFQKFLNSLMGRRVVFTQKRLESLLFKDAKTRIAEYLINQAEKKGRVRGGKVHMKNYLTHQEIASYTGTSRQTVTTILNQFRDNTLIEFDRKKIVINGLDEFKDATLHNMAA